ncbi:MAG: CBS domain-containing protein [Deltaproteobacteria bacterium]|nr:CBS domain-containing protein [Deltaproteobacteria bacterium]
MKIKTVMSTPVITIGIDETLLTASRLMKENNIKHLPVVDPQGRLLGIMTDRDLKKASASDATSLEVHELLYLLDRIQAEGVMTRHPVTVTAESDLRTAAKLMVENKIGCLPVLKGEELIGIITKDDLLRLVAKGG